MSIFDKPPYREILLQLNEAAKVHNQKTIERLIKFEIVFGPHEVTEATEINPFSFQIKVGSEFWKALQESKYKINYPSEDTNLGLATPVKKYPSDNSIRIAACCWCEEETKDRVMDVPLAQAFAQALDKERNNILNEILKEFDALECGAFAKDAWMERLTKIVENKRTI